MKLLNIFCLFLIFINPCYSQEALEKKHTAEIVFLNDSNLKSVIKKIIKKDNLCQAKSVQWSIEIMKDDIILVTKYNLENLIFTKGISNIYATIIDENILFLSGKNDINNIFTKSGHSINLISFINKENYSTIDYSFWVLQKKDSKKYKIIKEKKYPCSR